MSNKKPKKAKPTAAPKKAATKRELPDPNIIDVEGLDLGEPIASYLRSLPVILNQEEYDARGHEAGALSAQIKSIEADKRAKNEAFNADLKKLNARLDQVHVQLNTRTEDREVDVAVYADKANGLKLTVRTDTNRLLAKDKMTDAEKRGDVEVSAPVPASVQETETKGKKGRKVKRDEPAADAAPDGEGEKPTDGDDDAGTRDDTGPMDDDDSDD